MEKSSKILQLLLFLFIGNAGIQTAFAQTVWNGTANTAWNNNVQVEFTITTAEELAGLRQLVNAGTNDFRNKTVKLGANIMLNSTTNWQNWTTTPPARTWIPIGTNNNRFNGTFDGAGFTIQGVYISNANDYQGLFGGVGAGTIKNLKVTSSHIKGKNAVGGIVGSNQGTISNSYFSGKTIGSTYLGGLVGYNNGGDISDSYSIGGTVSGTGDNVGGLVGFNFGRISTSYSTNSVQGNSFVGGLVGNNSATIDNSYSTGTVKCGVAQEMSRAYCGGLVGNNYGGKIYRSYSTGEITDDAYITFIGNHIGGFAGKNENAVKKIIAEEVSEVLGESLVEIGCAIGGLIGCFVGYAIGSKYGTAMVSDIIGAEGEITLSHYDKQTSGQKKPIASGQANDGVTGRTTVEMKKQATFSSWNFTKIWDINNSYPFLRIVSSSSSYNPSYHIFEYLGKDAENMPTIYGSYIYAYIYNGATAGNPKDEYSDGISTFADGVAKLRNITLNPVPESYSGAVISMNNKTSGIPNIAECEKISYYYKGDPHWFLLEFPKKYCANPDLADDNKWGEAVTPAQSGWYKKTINLTTLKLARSWEGAGCGGANGNLNAVPLDLKKVTNISWVFDDNISGSKQNLMIANVACLTASGGAIADNAPPNDITVESGWPTPSYHIFAYNGKNAEIDTTVYGGYVAAYAYNDATIDNPKYNDGFIGFIEGVAKLRNVTLADADKYSGAGINIDNRISQKPNIADCNEISYYYKGDPHWFLVEFQKELCDDPLLADDNKWGLAVTPAQNTWTKKTIDLTKLKIARSWAGAGCGGAGGNIEAVPVDLSKATKISWVFDDNVNNGASKNLMIANVACLTPRGGVFVDNAPPEDITIASGRSSSSVTSSSSSSSGVTPIRPHQIATSNQAKQIHNGINLQTMSKAVVEIFNLKGSSISKQNFNGGVYTVSLGNLPKGMYIIKVSFGSEKHILRVPVH